MKHFSVKDASFPAAERKLAMQVQELQDRIGQLARMVEVPTENFSANGTLPHPRAAQRVSEILRARRARSRFFEEQLFADPAWDILLELYGCELQQQRMSVSSLCVGAAVPPTTALRWIRLLEKNGLITRTDDPFDGRRVFVRLTADAVNAMTSLFETIPPTESIV